MDIMSIQDTVVQVSGGRKTCRGGLERLAARAAIMTDHVLSRGDHDLDHVLLACWS